MNKRLTHSQGVLFVSLSGVRVKNEQLLNLGMTLPGFVDRSRVIASLPNLGLLTLAAWTPSHWNVTYREYDEIDEQVYEDICNIPCSLVAISALTARIYEAYQMADRLRSFGKTVVLGGLHVTALPDEALPHADAIVVGDGESTWPQLVKDFEEGVLQKKYDAFSKKPSYRLTESRTPRYDLLDPSKYNRLTLQTSRGCPLDCYFCGASRTLGPYRLKPIDHIHVELEAILKIWPQPFIELADDNTFVNKVWSRDLIRLFSQYSIKWFTETDISVADNEALLKLLAQSGCKQLLIGFESAKAEALQNVDSRKWKLRQFNQYHDKIQKIQSYGISVNGCFILGFDSDDESVFDYTLDFVDRCGLAEVQITLLTPFPGTPLYTSLSSSGRLLKRTFWDECTLFDVTFHPKQMSANRLEYHFHELMRSMYQSKLVAKRKILYSSLQ
jgi:radical SAM superfamily enzyme YgiQ (UPF0313 family)